MSDTMIDGLTQVILSLKPAKRRQLISRLADSRLLSEDEEDELLIELRKSEPSESYSSARERLKKKGRLK